MGSNKSKLAKKDASAAELHDRALKLIADIQTCKLEDTKALMLSYIDARSAALDAGIMSEFLRLICGPTTLEQLKSIDISSQICGAGIAGTDLMWKCLTCSKQGESTCFCTGCFRRDLHAGHRTGFKIFARGNCDCGDIQAADPTIFCERHRTAPSLDLIKSKMPGYILEKTPVVLGEITRYIHGLVATNQPEAFDTLSSYLGMLSAVAVNAVCQKLVADSLMLTFAGVQTKHRCNMRDTGTEHACTCSLVDFLYRYHHRMGNSKELFTGCVSVLARRIPEFAVYLVQAFWRNYFGIFENYQSPSTEECSNATYQGMFNYDKIIPFLIGFMDQLAGVIDSFRGILCVEPFSEELSKLGLRIYNDMCTLFDYNGIMIEKIVAHGKIIDAYVTLVVSLNACNIVTIPPSPDNYIDKYICEYYLFLHWMQTVGNMQTRVTQFSSVVLPLLFRKLADSENLLPPTPKFYSASMGMQRLLGIFLIRLAFSDPKIICRNKLTRESIMGLRELIRSATEMSDSALDIAMKASLARLARCVTFIFDCKMLQSPVHGILERMPYLYDRIDARLDIAAMQIILAVLLASPLHPQVDIIAILRDCVGPAAEQTADYKTDFVSEVLFTAAKLAFDNLEMLTNDIAVTNMAMKERRRIPEHRYASYEFAVQTSALNIIVSEDEAKQSVDKIHLDAVIAELEDCLKTDETEDMLEGKVLTTGERTPEGHTQFKVAKSAISRINIFNAKSCAALHSVEANLSRLAHVYSVQGEYDPFSALLGAGPTAELNAFLFEGLFQGNYPVLRGLVDMLKSPDPKFKSDRTTLCILAILSQAFASPATASSLKDCFGTIESGAKAFAGKSKLYEVSVRNLLGRMQVRPEEAKAESSTKGPEESTAKQLAEAKKRQAMAMFKKRQNEFASKHAVELEKVGTVKVAESDIVCSVCLEALHPDKFATRPYGRQVYSAKCSAIYYSMRQRLRAAGLDPSEIQLDGVHFDLLAHQTYRGCGHYMHCDCFNGKNKITSCPLCKEPVSELLPVLPRVAKECAAFCLEPKKNVSTIGLDEFVAPVYTLAMEMELVGFARSLLFRRDEVADMLKLVYSREMAESAVDVKKLKELAERYSAVSSPSLMLGLVLRATAAFRELAVAKAADTNSADIIDSVKEEVATIVLCLFIQNAARQDAEMTKPAKEIDEKSLFEGLGRVLEGYAKSRDAKLDMCAVLRQIILALSPFEAVWNTEYRNNIISQTKNENVDYFINFALTQVLRLKEPVTFEQIGEGAKKLLQVPAVLETAIKWLRTLRVADKDRALVSSLNIMSTPLTLSFIKLPETYDGLILKYFQSKCKECGENGEQTGICLFCGAILCLDRNCFAAAEDDLANLPRHSELCGLKCGLYLQIYRGSVLVQAGKERIDWGSIYENSAGNPVGTLMRGDRYVESKMMSKYVLSPHRLGELMRLICDSKEKAFVQAHKKGIKNMDLMQLMQMLGAT